MIAPRQTFIVRVHGLGSIVIENVGTRESLQVESLHGIAEQIGRWLAVEPDQAPPVTPLRPGP